MSRARNFPLLDSRMVSMGVLSDDFPTVDVREDYANLSLTEKTNSRGAMNGNKTNERKSCAAEKAAADPKRFSGDGSAPPRLSVWFSALFLLPFRGVCLAAASAASRTCLCQAHATVPNG